MIEFIDKTTEKSGTKINRANLMALQGFEDITVKFVGDNVVEEVNSNGEKLTTTFNDDGTITEKFEGEKTIAKMITFSENGVSEWLIT